MNSPTHRPLAGVGLLVRMALALQALLWLVDGFAAITAGFTLSHWDAMVDLRAARAFVDGYSPFDLAGSIKAHVLELGPAGLGHPPTTSFWFLPLARFDEGLAAGILTFVVVVLFSVQVTQMVRLKQLPAPALTSWVIISFVISRTFMRYHMNVGQCSAIIGFFFFLAWAAARRGRDVEAGLALGAACTLKLFPGMVVLMFVLNRRWRVVAGAAAAYLIVAAIMTSRFGLASWPVFLSKQKAIADMWLGNIQNQSIHGVVAHMFAPICKAVPPVMKKATYISSAISLVLLAFAGWLVWRSRAVRAAFDLQFWMFVVLSIICSQWTWEHYSVIYVAPMLILACHLVDRCRTGHWRNWSTPLSALGLVTIAYTWRFDHHTKEHLQTRYFMGDTTVHAKLHLYHVLNFAPGFILLAMMMAAVWASVRTFAPAGAPPTLAPTMNADRLP